MRKRIGQCIVSLLVFTWMLSCTGCGSVTKEPHATKKVEISAENWKKEPVQVSKITKPLAAFGNLVLPQVEDIGKEFVFLAYWNHYLTYRSYESTELLDLWDVEDVEGGYNLLRWDDLLDQNLTLNVYYKVADEEYSDYLDDGDAWVLLCEVTGENSQGQSRRHYIEMCMTEYGFTSRFENAVSEGILSEFESEKEREQYLSQEYIYAGETNVKIRSERAEQFYPEIDMTKDRRAEIDAIQKAVQELYQLDQKVNAAAYLPAFLPGDYYIDGIIVRPNVRDAKDQQDIPADMRGEYSIDALSVIIDRDSEGHPETVHAYFFPKYRNISGTYEEMYEEMINSDAYEREPEKYGLCWTYTAGGWENSE